MKNKQGFIGISLVIVIIAILAIAGGAYYFETKHNSVPSNVVENNVSQEGQEDVPVVANTPLPTTLPQYIAGQSGWPPVIQTSGIVYSCTPSHSEMGTTIEKIINGRTYCITTTSDGAAGSIYYTHTYKTSDVQGSSKTTTFALKYVSCGVYGGPTEPQVIQCKANQDHFSNSLDNLIDSLM